MALLQEAEVQENEHRLKAQSLEEEVSRRSGCFLFVKKIFT